MNCIMRAVIAIPARTSIANPKRSGNIVIKILVRDGTMKARVKILTNGGASNGSRGAANGS